MRNSHTEHDLQRDTSLHHRWWDWLGGVAFFLAMMAVASRLVATDWVSELTLVQMVALLGTLAGLALGVTRFSRLSSFLFSILYGLFVIPWQLGLTLGEGIEWRERALSMLGRISFILRDIVTDEPVTDNLFFLLLMAFLFWMLTTYGGFELTRYGDVWRALLPAGLAMFVINLYDTFLDQRTWYLAFYLFLGLIIVSRYYFLRMYRRWESRRTYVPPDAGFDFARYTLVTALVVVIVAWNSPAAAQSLAPVASLYSIVEKPWLEAKERMSNMFANLRATVGLVAQTYSEEMSLGTGYANTDSPVFRVTVPSPANVFPGYRYYWRARVYDTYQNGSWSTSLQEYTPFTPAAADLALADSPSQSPIEAEFTVLRPLLTVMGAPQPIWFSRAGEIQFASNPDGTIDLVTLIAEPVLRPGDVYTVRALPSTVTVKELREAGTEYPQWVLDRYLQLPEQITPRTRQLAELLAEGRTTPYDVANAMTTWLRENIEYREVIEAPPENAELVDWFLFDYRQGFCNYYSTAMIMMLRSQGIPARWAVGYAQGLRESGVDTELPDQLRGQVPDELLNETNTFLVRDEEAHAWPEVYFPGIGWVEFEPTVSEVAIFRPSGEVLSGPLALNNPDREDPQILDELPGFDELDQQEAFASPPPPPTPPIVPILISVAMLLLGLVVGFLALFIRRNPVTVRRWWLRVGRVVRTPLPVYLENSILWLGFRPPVWLREWAFLSTRPPIARAFMEVNHALARLEVAPPASATPTERVRVLAKLLPKSAAIAGFLLDEYQLAWYSPRQADVERARYAGKIIRNEAYREWLRRKVQAFKDAIDPRRIFMRRTVSAPQAGD